MHHVLLELQSIIEQIVSASRSGTSPVRLMLTFQTFSNKEFQFRGSYQLRDALNVLIENALQALMQY